MDKRSALVVSLLSLLLLFSFRGYADPMCSSPLNTTPTTYDPNSPSSFSVTCTNASAVFITIYNSTDGVLIPNNSMTTTNNNYAYSIILPAGTWKWTYYANDSSNNWDSPNNITLTIDKALPNLYLLINGNSTNLINIDKNWTTNFTAYSDANVSVFLNSNLTGWTIQNGTPTVSNITKLTQTEGIYNMTAYTVDNGNYSANNVTSYINISEIAPVIFGVPTVSDSIYYPSKSYQFNITWQDGSLGNVTFNIYNTTWLSGNLINLTFNSVLNMTSLLNYTIDDNANAKTFSVNVTDLPVGSYNYVWTAFDASGQNTSSTPTLYTVNSQDISSSIILSVPSSINSGDSLSISCYDTSYPLVNLTVSFLGFSLQGGNYITTSQPFTQSQNVNCQASGANSSGSVSQYVTVVPSSSSSGPSGSSSPGSFIIDGLASTLSINPGESKQVFFTLKNTLGEGAIANVTISVTGIDSSWYTPLSTIKYSYNNIPQTLNLTFKIPSDAETNNYTVKIAATGKLVEDSSTQTTPGATMQLTVASPQPIQPLPSVTVSPQETTSQDNNTANITSNQTSMATGLASAFEYLKNNLVLILAIAACLLIFIFRDDLTTALTGTEEKTETHKAKSLSPLKGLKNKLNYKIVVNLKKESNAKNLKETEAQGAEKIPEMVPEKEPKRPVVLEKEIKRDIKELKNIIESEKKVGKNKKKFNLGNN